MYTVAKPSYFKCNVGFQLTWFSPKIKKCSSSQDCIRHRQCLHTSHKSSFLLTDHQNWFGMDEELGPVSISMRREKVPHQEGHVSSSLMQYHYRIIIRTSELSTLRGAILEDAIPNIKHSNSKGLNVKEVLEYVAPEVQIGSLRLGIQSAATEAQLLKVQNISCLWYCYEFQIHYTYWIITNFTFKFLFWTVFTVICLLCVLGWWTRFIKFL